ncbi:MAG TPA: recombinase family protein [Candidatus Tectomicrobia bacterium]|jgi:site-specific DNA recombinase
MSCRQIAWRLSQARVPTRHDRQPANGGHKDRPAGTWAPSTIYKILTYQGYIGTAYFGKHRTRTGRKREAQAAEIAITVPAIVDDATFQAAQAQLGRNKQQSRRNRRHEYLLAGCRLRCGRCGHTMSGYSSPVTRRYRCSSVYTLPPEERCRGSIAAADVERRVWDTVEHVLNQPEIIVREVAKQQATASEQQAAITQEIADIDAALVKCDREAQRWADAYAAEVISLEELKGFRAGITTTRERLLGERVSRQAQLETLATVGTKTDSLVAYCARVRQKLGTFTMADKQAALEALDIQATWASGQELRVRGSIPHEPIVSTASQHV